MVTETFSVKTRTYYSPIHIQAAAMFARACGEVERTSANSPDDRTFMTHRGYVTGAVMSSVAFLEAVINELWADAAEQHLEDRHGRTAGFAIAEANPARTLDDSAKQC